MTGFVITTEDEHKKALKEVEPFFDLDEDELKADAIASARFIELFDAICRYEEIHYPIILE